MTKRLSRPRRADRAASAGPAIDVLVADVRTRLQPHAIAERRAFLSSTYAKTNFEWLGVPLPAMRRVVARLAKVLADAPPAAVLELARVLASRGVNEERQIAYELIGRRADVLALVTPALARRLGRGNDNWVTVDVFATSVTGPAWRAGALRDRDLLGWTRDPDPWWRRTALVSTVALNTPSRGGRGDAPRTLRVCRAAVGRLNPMLAKAMSWALRSLAPHDPAAVLEFVDRQRARLPPRVVREVVVKVATGRKRPPRGAR